MISVIIPCFNCEDHLYRAIQSVLNQSYQDTELILVNNNSTDNTMQLLEGYRAQFPQKISIYNELKPGAPAARNTGLKAAHGEWIQFLDADDELLKDKLSQQLTRAIGNNADVIAGGCILRYNIDGKIKEILRHADENVWRGLITSNLGITSSNLWRKATLTQVNGWDEAQTSSQEYDLLFRLLKNNAKVVADKSFSTIVHFSGNSVSKSKDSQKLKRIFDNRVNLRINIKKYLAARGRLTPTLVQTIDDYIYSEAMRMYPQIPAYARAVIRRHRPRVKWSKKFRQTGRMLLKRIALQLKTHHS